MTQEASFEDQLGGLKTLGPGQETGPDMYFTQTLNPTLISESRSEHQTRQFVTNVEVYAIHSQGRQRWRKDTLLSAASCSGGQRLCLLASFQKRKRQHQSRCSSVPDFRVCFPMLDTAVRAQA